MIELRRADLISALNGIKDTIAESGMYPFSKYIRMVYDGSLNILSLTTSDTTSSTTMRVVPHSYDPAVSGAQLTFPLVEYSLFKRLLSTIQDGFVTISGAVTSVPDSETQQALYFMVSSQSMKKPVSIASLDPTLFPVVKPDPFEKKETVTITGDDFLKAVTNMSANLKQAEGSALANCIAFKVSNDELICESYNDKLVRLSLLELKMKTFNAPSNVMFIMDYYKFKSILNYIDSQKDVTIDIYENYAIINADVISSHVRFLNGTFPNIKNMIPTQYVANTFVTRSDLLKVMNRVMLFVESNSPIKLLVKKNEIIIDLETRLGSVYESVPSATRGLENFYVEINPKGFLDTLINYPFENIMLLYPTAKAMIIGTAVSSPDFSIKSMIPCNYITTNAVSTKDTEPTIEAFADEASLPKIHFEPTVPAVPQGVTSPQEDVDDLLNDVDLTDSDVPA